MTGDMIGGIHTVDTSLLNVYLEEDGLETLSLPMRARRSSDWLLCNQHFHISKCSSEWRTRGKARPIIGMVSGGMLNIADTHGQIVPHIWRVGMFTGASMVRMCSDVNRTIAWTSKRVGAILVQQVTAWTIAA